MPLELNINNPRNFKAHRSGWRFVMNQIMSLHKKNGILFDDFIDITFGYNRISNTEKGIIPYQKPWIGVLHHPPHICPWYDKSYKDSIDIHKFLNSSEFLISLEKCECIIVLSQYLKNYLKKYFSQFKNIPIITLKHPTETGELEWNFDKFKKSSSLYGLKILNIGYFLRSMCSLYLIKSNRKLDKYLMPSDIKYGLNNLSLEFAYKKLTHIDKNSLKILNWQTHSFYDKLLEQSICFLDLYDTSCNNAIIECIARNTPLIINKHPAIQEYLGEDYPLYYEDLDDANKLINYDSIYAGYEYIKHNTDFYEYLNPKYFYDQFTSEVSKVLLLPKIKHTKQKFGLSTTKILTQPTRFNHRHGWSYVTQKLYNFYQNHNLKINKTSNIIYFNNFVEHTFKNDIRKSKSVIVDDQRHMITRGYNLFSANNTEVMHINDNYYEWTDSGWQQTKSKKTIDICNHNKIINYKTNDWIGIVHNPVDMPVWFDYTQNIHSILQNQNFLDSISNCKMLIALSSSLNKDLTSLFKKHKINTPIVTCLHPVPQNQKQFNFKKFKISKNIIQIGYWLRNMHSFWNLDCDLNKIWLYGDKFAAKMFEMEHMTNEIYHDLMTKEEVSKIIDSINTNKKCIVKNISIDHIPNKEYDDLLSNSIAFVNLYSSSANNAILECLSRKIPLLVNRLKSTEEYLGKDYPLFYDTLNEASNLSMDLNKILDAHTYLCDNNIDKSLCIDNFLSQINLEIKNICKR